MLKPLTNVWRHYGIRASRTCNQPFLEHAFDTECSTSHLSDPIRHVRSHDEATRLYRNITV